MIEKKQTSKKKINDTKKDIRLHWGKGIFKYSTFPQKKFTKGDFNSIFLIKVFSLYENIKHLFEPLYVKLIKLAIPLGTG